MAQAVIEAFNAGDWRCFKAPLAANVIYEEISTQRRVHDADAYVQRCQAWKQAFPDAKGIIRNVVSSGNTIVQEVLWGNTRS